MPAKPSIVLAVTQTETHLNRNNSDASLPPAAGKLKLDRPDFSWKPQLRGSAIILLMLMGLALVLPMTPGLAFSYGGSTLARNVLNTMMMSFFLMGLIGVLRVVIGYSLSFGTGFKSPFIGGLEFMGPNGVGGPLGGVPLANGFSISATSFARFQGMFAIITPALMSGAVVERINFKARF